MIEEMNEGTVLRQYAKIPSLNAISDLKDGSRRDCRVNDLQIISDQNRANELWE